MVPSFDPKKVVPDLSGKVILITGGTAGLGTEYIHQLLPHNPSQIIFTGRNTSAATSLISACKALNPSVTLTFVPMDLASFASIKKAATEIVSLTSRLDTVICNAGIMCAPPSLTTDGYELHMGTNHLGHALLIHLLLPLLLSTASSPDPSSPSTTTTVRIIWTTSLAAKPPLPPRTGIDFPALLTPQPLLFGPWRRYAQSKLSNLLYARVFATHHPSLLSLSIYPGVAWTGLVTNTRFWDRWFVYLTTFWMRGTVEEVAGNGVWASMVERGKVRQGAYYEPVGREGGLVGWMGDEGLAGRLWEWTEEQVGGWRLE